MEKKKKTSEKKKSKKLVKIFKRLFSILVLVSALFLIYSIFLISGIENQLRYILIAIIFVFNILFIILLRKIIKKENLFRYIIFIILSFVLIFAQGFVGYYLYKSYKAVDSFNKDKIEYETVLVVKKDNKLSGITALKDKKIGIVEDEKSVDGYIIGIEIIKEENFEKNNSIIEYDSINKLVDDLYKGNIDIMIVPKNYAAMVNSEEKYKDISKETKVIHSKKKKLTKKEIADMSGEEVSIINNSSIDKPFTVLLMGVDTLNSGGNGDSLMLITFNPKTLNATILSIPRDTYVPINGGREDKITHAAWGGVNSVIRTIQGFTGIKINYYVKIGFKGVVDLVDALGGIEVDVPEVLDGVCEQDSHRSWKKPICFKKGVQTLNGEAALAMARHRKTLATGDFQRGVHQQIIVQGMINKLKTIKTASQAMDVLNAVSKSMDTNFTTKQLLSFYDIGKNIVLTSKSGNLINLQQLYLTGSSQMISKCNHCMRLYNFIPNQSSLNQIKKAMKDNLNPNHVNKTKTFDFNIEEPFKMKVIGKYATGPTSFYTLLPSFVGKDIDEAKTWLEAHNVKVNVEEKLVTDEVLKEGEVITQSESDGQRIEYIKEITLTIAKIDNSLLPDDETGNEEIDPNNPNDPNKPDNPDDPIKPDNPDEPTKPDDPGTGDKPTDENNPEDKPDDNTPSEGDNKPTEGDNTESGTN